MPTEENPARATRDSRFNIRTSAKQDSLIRTAADAQNKSVSEFVLDSATAAAEDVLADRRFFAITEESWRAFEAALDRPAVLKPTLAELLHENPTFEPRT